MSDSGPTTPKMFRMFWFAERALDHAIEHSDSEFGNELLEIALEFDLAERVPYRDVKGRDPESWEWDDDDLVWRIRA